MYIGVLDTSHTKKEIERGNHKRKSEVNKAVEQPSTSGLNSAKVPGPEIQISKLRKRNTAIVHEFRSSESESDQDYSGEVDQEYEPPRAAVEGKLYEKVHSYLITDRSCVLADRRMVSIRQQSDILKSSLGNEIAASPSTVYRQREKELWLKVKIF